MRPLTSLAACLTLVGAGVLGGTAAADAKTTPPPAARASVKTSPYVALGDSYSSGAGIAPFVAGSPATCSRSTLNFAHDIAAITRPASFTDVTCSGAKTADFFGSQAAGVPPQLQALSKRTRLVTMTIGGNDEDVFTSSFFGCTQLTATDPTGNPCQQKYGSTFTDLIRSRTYPNVVRALRAVRHHAPRATVVILGYPQILPPTGSLGCTAVSGIAVGDVPWLVAQEKVLNRVVRRAAARTGARYVDTFTPSAGHDACSGPGVRWLEPLAPVNAYPVHPNATGEQAMADETLAALRRR
ncbi:SGNH/GDSL hydrolase family protein [Nocardioides korecus]